ncbi:MAG: hypothetical protein LBQ60_11995 [Bacteroidales bacterium]|jgi:hypothetical protein|nr:hypothetical protein [Bacteroidales bacterium]
MKLLIFILLTSLSLISCKSPQKSVSSSKINQETNISNDILLTEDTQLSELKDQIIKRLINEQLNIGIKQIKYDTDKPMNKETGKHPMIEEIELMINMETEVYEMDSIRQKTDQISTIELKDNSNISTTIKAEAKEKKENGLKKWQRILITVGGITILGLIVFTIIKVIR